MKASPDLTMDSYGAATGRCLRVPGPRGSVSVHVSRSLHGRPRFPMVLPGDELGWMKMGDADHAEYTTGHGYAGGRHAWMGV